MATDVMVPTLGESVSEATVTQWFKKVGDSVAQDEVLCELETDKVTLEVPSPAAGVLEEIIAGDGAEVSAGGMLGRIAEGATAAAPKAEAPKVEAPKPAPAAAPAAPRNETLSPAVSKIVADNKLDASQIPASGPKGNILKEDALKAAQAPKPAAPAMKPSAPAVQFTSAADLPARPVDPRGEERVRLTKLRKTIATRLKEAQNNAAMLTTFNEVQMDALMTLRTDYKDTFEKKHGAKLGFMSFFVKAAIVALKELPAVNAEIFGDEIIYKNFYDIGIAVGTPQGLVVPVLRDADKLSFAEIELAIADFGKRAREGKLTIQEMMGGTFTITNGGVFGSLLSTPILNPPQSGILGMHKIQKRPIVDAKGNIVVGNMMYLAHSYDHRIIDGREAVTFLVRMKDVLEDPARLLLDV